MAFQASGETKRGAGQRAPRLKKNYQRTGALPTKPARLADGLGPGSVLREGSGKTANTIRPMLRPRALAVVPPRYPSRRLSSAAGSFGVQIINVAMVRPVI